MHGIGMNGEPVGWLMQWCAGHGWSDDSSLGIGVMKVDGDAEETRSGLGVTNTVSFLL